MLMVKRKAQKCYLKNASHSQTKQRNDEEKIKTYRIELEEKLQWEIDGVV
jgi:hypothetical protein